MENTQPTPNKPIVDFNAMDGKTKVMLGASVLGIISCFLPLVKINFFLKLSASLFDGGGFGYVIFICFLGVLAMSLFGSAFSNSKQLMNIFVITLGALWGFLNTILLLITWTSGVSPEPVKQSIFDFIGIGFYLASISIIVMVFAQFAGPKNN
ncbi:MAG: hypothetical protein A2W91_01695 [Bacteroidetes bacterium GWF2_38_335]|nr:MAG: hypothetical protein A2W91_01695 [Bacteroidetes bacterium GWF2_38_335]OFY78783.1 MAG: hypothetical protein A2281_19270 [Bacteroidetes bacterium RIFOXYA12_FULL_38_20]HBS85177.1 hypothetical protein [Bacteroidales bacterium]